MNSMRKGNSIVKPGISRLITYVIENNANGVRKLAYNHGYAHFNTKDGAYKFLNKFLSETGERGFDELIMQHPDRDVVLEVYNSRFPNKLNLHAETADSSFYSYSGVDANAESIHNTLGILIVKRKEQVLNLLAEYGVIVNDPDDLHEISAKLMSVIHSGNKSFASRIASEITSMMPPTENYSDFVPALITGVTALGSKVFDTINSGAQNKMNAANNAKDITMAALNYRMSQDAAKVQQRAFDLQSKNQDSKNKNKPLIIGLSIGAALLVLIVTVFTILKVKNKI